MGSCSERLGWEEGYGVGGYLVGRLCVGVAVDA
jgi:hypothetical protein